MDWNQAIFLMLMEQNIDIEMSLDGLDGLLSTKQKKVSHVQLAKQCTLENIMVLENVHV
jgi:hypothetical protein